MNSRTLQISQPHRPSILAKLRAMLAVRQQRDHLASLDADRLSDLGLTKDQAMAEAQRPIWDVPARWRL